MRRLYGAQRLRSDRGAGCDQESVEGGDGRVARREDRRRHGAGNQSREPTPGAVRFLAARREDARRDPGRKEESEIDLGGVSTTHRPARRIIVICHASPIRSIPTPSAEVAAPASLSSKWICQL